MKNLFFFLLVVLFAGVAHGADYYYGESAAGSENASSCANRDDIAGLNADAQSLSPGDNVYLCDDEDIRTQITVPAEGTGESLITITSAPGDNAVLNGATTLGSWTDEGSNIWYASQASEPWNAFFTDGSGNISWGLKETDKVDVDEEYDWWFDDPNNRVYVYSTSDPGTAYDSVEVGKVRRAIYASAKDYVKVTNIEIKFQGWDGTSDGIFIAAGCTGWEITNNTIHHIGNREATEQGDGVQINDGTHTISNNTVYECGRHGIYVYADATGSSPQNFTIEDNLLYNNYHTQIDFGTHASAGANGGHVVKNNLMYVTDAMVDLDGNTAGIAFTASSADMSNVTATNNVMYGPLQYGIIMNTNVIGFDILNNTIYSTKVGSGIGGITTEGNGNMASGVVKNNIVYINSVSTTSQCLYFADSNDLTSDYNIIYNANGKPAHIDGTPYSTWNDYRTAFPAFDANSSYTDPLLNSDYTLQSRSPCINAGTDPFSNGDGDQYDYNDYLVWSDTSDSAVGPWADGVEIGAYGFVGGPAAIIGF
jgi:hypothetical protein